MRWTTSSPVRSLVSLLFIWMAVQVFGGSSVSLAAETGIARIAPVPPEYTRVSSEQAAGESSDDAGDKLERIMAPQPLSMETERLVSPDSFSLAEIEATALGNNPTIAESVALLNAARWRRLQVGLRKNPRLGYIGNEIGDDGRAGQQGALLEQTIVRGQKRQLNRNIVTAEIKRLEQNLAARRTRVLTDVRIGFYDLLVIQEREKILSQLESISQQTQDTALRLFEAQESPKTDYLQARIEHDRVQLDLQAAETTKQAAWRELLALAGIGLADESPVPKQLDGQLEPAAEIISRDEMLARVMTAHPEVTEAIAGIDRARASIRRARAEPISDLDTGLSVQYDNATGNTFASVTAAFEIPVWDRNQGGIGEARADLSRAQAHVALVEQRLLAKFDVLYGRYLVSHNQVLRFRSTILPQTRETQELIGEGYRQGDLRFLDYLTAQRTFYQSNLRYLDVLKEYWRSLNLLNGLLLNESLASRP